MKQIVIIHEHPAWQKPLFEALSRRGIDFGIVDLKKDVLNPDLEPESRLYFNQASPSAYVRGNTSSVPMALAFMQSLETMGVRVLNGSSAFLLELSKSAQISLMKTLGVDHPKSLLFHNVDQALSQWDLWPALLKPQQGGSGARMYLLESKEDLKKLLRLDPGIWFPDHLLMLQEYFPIPREQGIVRMEFVGGELLYAMRVVSHGSFNLCPSEMCNPADGKDSVCEIPQGKPVEFFACPEVPTEAVAMGKRLVEAGKLDVAGIEYLQSEDGRLIFYDVNANSNLRPAIASHFGFDPFERVVDYLENQIKLV